MYGSTWYVLFNGRICYACPASRCASQLACFCALPRFLFTFTLSSLPTSVFACYFWSDCHVLQVRDCFSNWATLPEALLAAFPVVLEIIVLFHQRLFLFFTAERPTVFSSLDVAVGIYAAPSASPQPLYPRRVRAFTLWLLVCFSPAV